MPPSLVPTCLLPDIYRVTAVHIVYTFVTLETALRPPYIITDLSRRDKQSVQCHPSNDSSSEAHCQSARFRREFSCNPQQHLPRIPIARPTHANDQSQPDTSPLSDAGSILPPMGLCGSAPTPRREDTASSLVNDCAVEFEREQERLVREIAELKSDR